MRGSFHASLHHSTDNMLSIRPVILSLRQPSGVFAGDSFGEVDTRFLYCAVNALSLLGKLHLLDKDKTVAYIERCRNFDGGFGSCVGAESHAAQGESAPPCLCDVAVTDYYPVFVCVAALAILDRLDVVDDETLGWWLCERQLPNGGLNGRPEKLEDVEWTISRWRSYELTQVSHRSATVFGCCPQCPS